MSEREMQVLIELVEKALGAGYLDIADWLRESNDVGAIEEAIRRGDYAGAIKQIEEAARKLASDVNASYVQAGQAAAEWIDSQPQAAGALVRFDITNDRAVARAKASEYELVQGYVAEQRETTRQVISDGLARGANPREMARDIRDGLGLTPYQSQIVSNYRRELESGLYADAMTRRLHNGQNDRTLERLEREGKGLTPAQIDKMTEQYRQGWVDYRAETIARTEALRSVHEGTEETFRQAIERGDIDAEDLTTEWHAGPRTMDARPEHQAISGTTVPYGQDFVMGDGTRMAYPGDPRGGAKHNANCRCAVSRSLL